MAVVKAPFVDTNVLLGGLIELGPQVGAAQRIFDAIVAGDVGKPHTAWHCCLEFYSVATRLPEAFRLRPEDASKLLEEEVAVDVAVAELSVPLL